MIYWRERNVSEVSLDVMVDTTRTDSSMAILGSGKLPDLEHGVRYSRMEGTFHSFTICYYFFNYSLA